MTCADSTPRASKYYNVSQSCIQHLQAGHCEQDFIKNAEEARLHPNEDWPSITHYLRHDLESLFYVAVYSLSTYVLDQLNTAEKDALRDEMLSWERAGNLNDIWKSKNSCCIVGFGTKLSPATRPLKKWLRAWTRVFARCNEILLQEESSDEDTSDVSESDASQPPETVVSDASLSDEQEAFDAETLNDTFTPAILRAALKPYMPLPIDVAVNSTA